MKKWLLTASTDGNLVDFECIIQSENEPDFWTCYTIAEEHDCSFFHIDEMEAEEIDGAEVLTIA